LPTGASDHDSTTPTRLPGTYIASEYRCTPFISSLHNLTQRTSDTWLSIHENLLILFIILNSWLVVCLVDVFDIVSRCTYCNEFGSAIYPSRRANLEHLLYLTPPDFVKSSSLVSFIHSCPRLIKKAVFSIPEQSHSFSLTGSSNDRPAAATLPSSHR
jgi:hypothetical protein